MAAEVITKSVVEVTLNKDEENGDFVDPWNVESKNDSEQISMRKKDSSAN